MGGHRGRPHQAEHGGRTGREPQAGGEPGPCLPAHGEADRPERRHEPTGFAGIDGDKVRQAFGEDAAPTGGMAADEFPDRQVEPDRPRPPGEIRQVALIPAMDGRRGRHTARAGSGRRRRRQLEPHRCLLNGDLREAELMGGERNSVIKVWSSWVIIAYDTAISPDFAPAHQK